MISAAFVSDIFTEKNNFQVMSTVSLAAMLVFIMVRANVTRKTLDSHFLTSMGGKVVSYMIQNMPFFSDKADVNRV